MASQALTRNERIRRRAEFQAVLDRGQRAQGRYMTLVLLANRGRAARLGIVVSRRLGGATTRNRAKRLIRNVFRRNKSAPGIVGRDLVVIPRPGLLGAAFAALEADFCAALRRHGRHSQ